MSEFCVFCYKATEAKFVDSSGKDFDSTVDNNALSKFSKILDRFGNVAKEDQSSDLANMDKLNRSKWLSCCEACTAIIDGFCEDFHKLKCLEMTMEWKLQRLKDSMEYAGRVPSRWFKLQQFFKIQKFIEGSNENNDDILEHLKSYREHILKKCKPSIHRLSKSQPRVHLKRIDYYYRFPTETVSDDAGSNIEHSTRPSPRKIIRNMKVEDDESVAENCLLFEEDNQYTTTRKLKQDPDSDNDWIDDNNCPSDDEDNFSADEDNYPSEDHGSLSSNHMNSPSEEELNLSTEDKDEDSFKCKHCKKTYLTEQRLKDHMRKIHVKRKHKCSLCEKVFKIKPTLRQHMITHTDPSTWRYKCSLCSRPFATKHGMLKHQRTHKVPAPDGNVIPTSCQSIQPPVLCPKCDKTFANNDRLKDHLRRFHAPPKLKCSKCPRKFKTRDDLRKHGVRAHTDPTKWKFKCSTCGKAFIYNSMLMDHVYQNHRDSQTWDYKCSVCEKPFFRKSTMLHHMATHQGGADITSPTANTKNHAKVFAPVPCPKCDKPFANKDRLKDHLTKFHAPRKIKCSKCPMKFKVKADLKKHEMRIHTDPSTWKFKCSTCGKPFMYNSMLQAHIYKNHTDPQSWNYKCSVCGKPFLWKNDMLQHMATHLGKGDIASAAVGSDGISPSLEKFAPVPCQRCDKMFANEMRLKDHMKRFHVPRSHKCSKCNQKFKTKDNLSKHNVYVHSDKKTWKFQCSLCDLRFVYNSMLQAHRRKTHKEEMTRSIKKEN